MDRLGLCAQRWVVLRTNLFGVRDELQAKLQTGEKGFKVPKDAYLLGLRQVANVTALDFKHYPVATDALVGFAGFLAVSCDPALQGVKLNPRCLYGWQGSLCGGAA